MPALKGRVVEQGFERTRYVIAAPLLERVNEPANETGDVVSASPTSQASREV